MPRLRWATLAFALLGALVGGIYGGLTWHPICSPEDFVPIFCSRGDRIGLYGFLGLIIGAIGGALAWSIVMAVSLVFDERRELGEKSGGDAD